MCAESASDLTPPCLVPASTVDPDSKRALALDAHVRERLADSLRYILSAAADELRVAPSALDEFFRRLHAGPIPSLTFGAYFELVLALDAGNFDGARQLLTEIAQTSNHPAGTAVIDLAHSTGAERYRRLMNADPAVPFEILAPPPQLVVAGERTVRHALALLARADRDLADEIGALLREIVLATGSTSHAERTFDGASSLMLWGAIVVNLEEVATTLDMAQAIVHESGHNLLFGLSVDQPLVENDAEARYSSPLREDPRPMDGVVHAAFVTARMHRSLSRLLESDVLSPEDALRARSTLPLHFQNLELSLATIEKHAVLTALGRSVVEDIRRHMAR